MKSLKVLNEVEVLEVQTEVDALTHDYRVIIRDAKDADRSELPQITVRLKGLEARAELLACRFEKILGYTPSGVISLRAAINSKGKGACV